MKKLFNEEKQINIWLLPKGDNWVLQHGKKELMVFTDYKQGVRIAKQLQRVL